MESSGLATDIWTVVQTCWNLQRLCGFIWLFFTHVNYYYFHSVNRNNFNKGPFEFQNDRFVDNY